MDPSGPLLNHVSDGTINRQTGFTSQGISRSRREDGRTSHPLSSYSFASRLSIPNTPCSHLRSTVDASEHTFDDPESATTSFRMQFSDTHLVPPKAERQKQNLGWVAHHLWAGPPRAEHSTSNARGPLQWSCQKYLSAATVSQAENSNSGDELNRFIQKHSTKSVYSTCSLADCRPKESHFQ
jgi:hypothetical protein